MAFINFANTSGSEDGADCVHAKLPSVSAFSRAPYETSRVWVSPEVAPPEEGEGQIAGLAIAYMIVLAVA
jgi:hypothetical protein